MKSKKNNIFYIYHIFGKKIGVTRNLDLRVHRKQGYKPGEYEILDASSDIDYISKRELELQKEFNYEIDNKSYKDLKFNKSKNIKKENQMELNITEQTTTFPCPVNKLKGQLMDNLGASFSTSLGTYTLDHDLIEWIVENAITSSYRETRCFIYNKALAEAVTNNTLLKATPKKAYLRGSQNIPEKTVFDKIRVWAKERGIYEKGDAKTQYVKLQEESGELARAILKDDRSELMDAIGDMVVVLTNLAALNNLAIEDCIETAYRVIESRKGKMVNGTFVKETL
jgi:NTP pyrophosphatase (non-canonical NTP hydrolase)